MKQLFTLIIFLFSTLILSSQNECGELNKKTEKTFESAMENLSQARKLSYAIDRAEIYYKESYKLLQEVIDDDPEYGPAYYYLGYINIHKKQNNLELATEYFEKALKYCPDGLHMANYYLGKLYFGMNKKDLAAKYMKSFLDKPDLIEEDSLFVEARVIYDWSHAAAELMQNPVPFDPEIVPGISGPKDEYLVSISPDNEIAMFTRKTEVNDDYSSWSSDVSYKEKFFISKRTKGSYSSLHEAPFDEGVMMPEPFNREQNEGGPTLTINNKEMVYTVCRFVEPGNQNSYYNCDLYYTRYRFGEWDDIIPLSAVNNDDSWESQPSISADGKTLYFISNRKGGIGGYDIYTSSRDESGTWGTPVNMGNKINSKGNEKSPFIHSDSQTLYFSSEGRPGMGGYDIYYAKMNDNGTWQDPKNIGYPINSEYDDVGFIVSTDGHYGYFASNNMAQSVGGWDFYSFELYEGARPEKVLFVKGTVISEANDEPVHASVEMKNIATKEVTEIPVDYETGEYVAVMRFDNDYVMTVKKTNFVYESEYFSVEDTTLDEPTTVEVDIKPVEIGKSYKMNDIYYESNSADLTPSSKKVLDEFIEFLNENPNIKVAIEGHTDDLGPDQANLVLSQNRAKSVYDYLVANGVSASRLGSKGYGESRPVASNDTPEGRAKNRRTEFLITGM
ncbi:MAG: OmpA family protein [Bacteroidales bacterium]|nr:OmpA family protein [Bacteroidales bacterium]